MMHRRSRDNPEGDSIQKREKQRLQGMQNMLVNTPTYGSPKQSGKSRKRPPQDRMEDIENAYMVRKARQSMMVVESTSPGTPETISQISVIAPPVSNVTQVSDAGSTLVTKGRKKSPRGRGDDTWEMAVDRARGQPDGGESNQFSPSPAKRSRRVPQEEAHYEEIPEVDYRRLVATKMQSPEFSMVSAPEFERKKSVKIKVQSAAKKLKKKAIANKRGLNHSKVSKRKFEETLPDETVVNVKRAKVKDMTWKERRQARKIKKNNYELIQKAKHVWETCRRHELTVEQRHQICADLFATMRDKVTELAYAHDTARIIQCLVQNGDMALRAEIMEILKDHLVDLCKSKYGKFIVRKLLKYGSKQQRNALYKIFHGHVKKLLRHKEGSAIMEYAYNQYANASQRLAMLEEFYGPTFLIFKTHTARTLEQIVMSNPNKRDMIMSNMKESLLPLADKEIIVHSMVHRLFFEFFCFASEKHRSEMIEALRESVVNMLHTRDGARVAMFCIWHGTAKDRKVIIKSFKTHAVKICKEEYGHLVLLAMFDVVDDTKIVQKIILDEMVRSVAEVAEDQYGRKVLLYLLSPRDPQHFHRNIVHILEEGDSNAISKKDASVRQRELLEHISPCLLSLVKTSACSLVTNNASILLVLAVIEHAIGDPSECMEAIAELAAEPFIAGEQNRFHLVEDTAGHIMLKKLIAGDKDRLRTGKGALFSKILLDALPDNALKSWAACNRGCFVLISLLELEDAEVEASVLEQLSGLKKSLRKMTMEGPKILLQKLEALSPSKQPKMVDL